MSDWSPKSSKCMQISLQDLCVTLLGAETLLNENANFVFRVIRKCTKSLVLQGNFGCL